MPTEIRMPRLVDTMTQGTVVAWRAQLGERVTAGDVIAEIEVDRTTVDLKAPDGGTLTKIAVPAGSEEVEVGAVLAILEPGGDPAPTVVEELVSPASTPADQRHCHPEQPDQHDPIPVEALLDPMPF